MPNANRERGGVPYYSIPRSRHNYLCQDVDNQIEEHISAIRISPELLPKIRKAYLADIARYTRDTVSDRKALETRARKLDEKELNLWRAFTDHGMRANIYEQLTRECQEERQRIESMIAQLKTEESDHVTNLDAALQVISQIGERFPKCTSEQQRAILLQMVERVIINRAGRIKSIEWKSPFCYLMKIAEPVNGEPAKGQKKQKDAMIAASSAGCDVHVIVRIEKIYFIFSKHDIKAPFVIEFQDIGDRVLISKYSNINVDTCLKLRIAIFLIWQKSSFSNLIADRGTFSNSIVDGFSSAL